jgi:ParB family chromosome partitioning protein
LYTVIIGHRRLAAAKAAGLDEVPCVIVEMSEKDQLSTMLTENMQRVDLTVYEQAQGFQLMLDMGDTVEQIAGKSGFSKTTVRKRIEIAKLDEKTLKKVSDRQLSMADFDELAKLDSINARNKVLETIGTANFKNTLKSALDDQKLENKLAEWLQVIKTFAEEDPNANMQNRRYYCSYDRWHLNSSVTVPEDAGSVKYFYKVGAKDIVVYKEVDQAKEDAARAEREARQRKAENKRLRYEDINCRHYDLRCDFVKDLTSDFCKKNWVSICGFVADTIFQVTERTGYSRDTINLDTLGYMLGVKVDKSCLTGDDRITEIPGIKSATEAFPEKTMLCIAYCLTDNESNGYWRKVWGSGEYIYQHNENASLDMLYEVLGDLGYAMSDEEKKMQSGDHRIFLPGGDECEEDQNG